MSRTVKSAKQRAEERVAVLERQARRLIAKQGAAENEAERLNVELILVQQRLAYARQDPDLGDGGGGAGGGQGDAG